jgi:hypothetical protein
MDVSPSLVSVEFFKVEYYASFRTCVWLCVCWLVGVFVWVGGCVWCVCVLVCVVCVYVCVCVLVWLCVCGICVGV